MSVEIIASSQKSINYSEILENDFLGFDKPKIKTRVVIAMSGGVDSSVCAAMLAKQGYEVIGLTMQLYDHGAAIKSAKACCAGQDIYDARRVAEQFGFAHYVLDYESRFSDAVMEDFADTYLQGATPIPCIRCNQTVKFQDLLDTARDLGADCMVTGHYVRRIEGEQAAELHRAIDESKDQSYFLFATTKEQIEFLRFPLGGLDKQQTRQLAKELGLKIAAKPDSQDICFVPDGKYSDVIEKLRPGASKPGDIVHISGRVLGRHNGIMNYTIGQRRGLGIENGSGRDPLYVLRIDAKDNKIIVGERKKLLRSRIYIKDINWLGEGEFAKQAGRQIMVKTRSTRPPSAACLEKYEHGLYVKLQTSEEGIAPGQACVFYDADIPSRVLGGGWIVAAK